MDPNTKLEISDPQPVQNNSIVQHAGQAASRWGQPDDFKGVTVFLASAASDYMNGTIVTVDGGWMGR